MAIIDLITEKFLKIEPYQDQDWGTWGTRLGHSFGALGALVWGTWGTRLGHLRHSSGALEALVWGP